MAKELGPIPDNDPSGLLITFPVNGLNDSIGSVSLDLTINHTWVGDLIVTLTAPDGISSIKVFGSTGYRRSGSDGSSANLNGTYTFNDSATGDWWQTISGQGSSFEVPEGSYRSSTAAVLPPGSIASLSDFGGCTTRLNGAFHGLTPSQANGNWILSVRDQFGGDTGSVSEAKLTISPQNGLSDLIFFIRLPISS